MSKDYNENSIQVLSALDHMKRRSGMYIGSNQDARQLLSEIIDNAIDEVQAGFSNELIIYIDTKKNEYTVRDFGRGIPHGKKKLDNGLEKEIVEVLLTESNSGGKFDTTAYNYSSGLNGLGITITNALSDFIQIETYRNGKVVTGRDENGSGNVTVTYDKTNEPNGTKVTFKPCKKYFHTEKIPVDFAKDRCRVASAMGFRARLIVDEKEIDTNAIIFDLIKEEDSSKVSTYVNIPMIEVTSSTKEKMKVAVRYTSETNDRYFGFTNLLSNYLGGTHVLELSRTVVQGWKEFVEEHRNIRPSVELRNDDYLVGMRAVCAVFISAPEYSSQTKEKLVVNKKYFEELMNLFKKEFKKYLKENIVTAQQLLKRFEEYRISQNQLLSRKEISSLIKINNDSSDNIRRRSVVSKLVECTSRSRKDTDLYICLKGDTKVRLLSGESIEIEKLVDKENLWGYSTNEKGQFIPGKIRKVFKTQDVTDMLRITFSDGSTIECTPQHKFLDRDSMSWVEARNMFVGQSMFSMKFRKNVDVPNDHEKVLIPMEYTSKYSKNRKNQGHWADVHKLVAEYLHISYPYDGNTKMHIHHKDFDRYNNNPENLEFITKKEHFSKHGVYNGSTGIAKEGFLNMSPESYARMCAGNSMRTEAGKERTRQGIINSWEKDRHNPMRTWARLNSTEYGKQLSKEHIKIAQKASHEKWLNMTESEREQLKDKNRQGTLRRKRIQCIHMCQELIDKGYEVTDENWKNHVWKNGYPLLKSAVRYFGSLEEFLEEVRNYNLKVTSIEDVHYDEPIPVYCLDIDTDFHSFVLENGILSHNCEGDSAKGPFMFTRNPKLQAVLPLRGKILNITNKSVKDAIKNSEICDIANSIGCGIGSACDAEKSRYERIIIAADADPDGQQITCLVLSVFVNMFPDLVKAGRVYIAEPPLYCWGDNPKNYGWCNKVEDVPKGVNAVRFKGLGEMENSQLYHFLVNPETRNIKQVQFPSDLDEFNSILGTTAGKRDLLKELGIIEVEE